MSSSQPQPIATPLLERCSPGLADELRSYLVRHRAAVEAMVRRAGPDAGPPAAIRYAKT
jgi:hypothetical protein